MRYIKLQSSKNDLIDGYAYFLEYISDISTRHHVYR
jgi:hypothetical protein